MALERDREALLEVWGLYAVGTFSLFLRCVVRIRMLGLFGLQLEDAFAFVVLVCWTIICVSNPMMHDGTAMDFTPAETADFDWVHIRKLEHGSKVYLALWHVHITMVYSLKATVVILYQRIAFGNWQTVLLRWTKLYCFGGYIAIICVINLSCWPYSAHWQVRPLAPTECTAMPQAFITLSVLNASSDALLLCIPVPLLWRLKLAPLKKFGVVVLLSSGIFVIAACIVHVSLTAVPTINLQLIARWGARESVIAILAVNTTILRPMFRKSFWIQCKPAELPRKNYMFASLHRARRALSRNHASNFFLNSYSPGTTTIEQYNQQRSHGSEQPSTVRQLKDLEKGNGTCATVSVSNHDSS